MLKVSGIFRLGSALRQRQIHTGVTRLKRRKTAEEKVRPIKINEMQEVTQRESAVSFVLTSHLCDI